MQLILTTHEQQFFKFLVDEQRLSGQQGLIAPLNKGTRVATVVNGSTLGREYAAAIAANDDALAHKFISDVRIYCEDLLKCMMRSEGPGIANMNLDSLKKELKRLREASIPPFNRSAFEELSDMLMGGGGGPMKLINDSHHQYDGTIGVAQARREVWQRTRSAIIAQYALCRSRGICEGCEHPAPFMRRNGQPYLEIHHICALEDGGADHPLNVAAVCPNCHSRVTHGKDSDDYNAHIAQNVKSVEAKLQSEA